jgi:5-methylcytosine-specific restriction enzyme A
MGQFGYMYRTKVWKTLRKVQLAQEPLCRRCSRRGVVEQATVVNHIKPHKGDENLFRDVSNLESVCKHCHDSRIKSQEMRDYWFDTAVGDDGMPIDANHPFYAGSD